MPVMVRNGSRGMIEMGAPRMDDGDHGGDDAALNENPRDLIDLHRMMRANFKWQNRTLLDIRDDAQETKSTVKEHSEWIRAQDLLDAEAKGRRTERQKIVGLLAVAGGALGGALSTALPKIVRMFL